MFLPSSRDPHPCHSFHNESSSVIIIVPRRSWSFSGPSVSPSKQRFYTRIPKPFLHEDWCKKEMKGLAPRIHVDKPLWAAPHKLVYTTVTETPGIGSGWSGERGAGHEAATGPAWRAGEEAAPASSSRDHSLRSSDASCRGLHRLQPWLCRHCMNKQCSLIFLDKRLS